MSARTHKIFEPASTQDKSKAKVILRPTVSRSVGPSIGPPSGARDQIFLFLSWKFSSGNCFFPYRASPMTRGWVCILYLLLDLASVVFLWSESLTRLLNWIYNLSTDPIENNVSARSSIFLLLLTVERCFVSRRLSTDESPCLMSQCNMS